MVVRLVREGAGSEVVDVRELGGACAKRGDSGTSDEGRRKAVKDFKEARQAMDGFSSPSSPYLVYL